MPRVGKAGVVEGSLVDRIGDHGPSDPTRRKVGRTLDRSHHGSGVFRVRPARLGRNGEQNRQNRQPVAECRRHGVDFRDSHHRHIEAHVAADLAQSLRIVQRDEATITVMPRLPGAQRQFATDAGGIAHGECEGEHLLDMQRPSADRQRGFLHSLAQAGMRMRRAGEVLR